MNKALVVVSIYKRQGFAETPSYYGFREKLQTRASKNTSSPKHALPGLCLE